MEHSSYNGKINGNLSQNISIQVESVPADERKQIYFLTDLFLTTIKARMLEGSDYTNSADHITTSCLFPPTLTSCLLSATSCSRN